MMGSYEKKKYSEIVESLEVAIEITKAIEEKHKDNPQMKPFTDALRLHSEKVLKEVMKG